MDATHHSRINSYWVSFSSRSNLIIFSIYLYFILTYILGISAYFHDSSACLLRDGEVIAAVQEERFTRIKQDHSFPVHSIVFCLTKAGISIDECEAIVFFEKPFLKFERILETALRQAPKGYDLFRKAIPLWVKEKLFMKSGILKALKKHFKFSNSEKLKFSRHHMSHAASAFWPSGFEESAILVADGVGEWSTTSICHGTKQGIKLIEEIEYPHSIGLFYSAITRYLGFKVNSGEYKVMGLAPYGEPKYVDLMFSKLLLLKDDGSYQLNMKYFGFTQKLDCINSKFIALFGEPARSPEDDLSQFHKDIARSAQKVCELTMVALAKRAIAVTGSNKLCLSGGVALNCVANQRIKEALPQVSIWVQPASGDAGTALGAAMAYYTVMVQVCPIKPISHMFLGPDYSSKMIANSLETMHAKFDRLDINSMNNIVSSHLSNQKIVGWFQGAAEFGPRALGNRSILADPRNPAMQKDLNIKIKFREGFRPFAPAILEEHRNEYFSGEGKNEFMLFTENCISNDLPATTHLDKSARVQTVTEQSNQRFYSLLNAFYTKTKCPTLINTSFNVRGEPPVLSPKDAYRCFMSCHLDVLVIGDFILLKEDQPEENRKIPIFDLD